LGVWVLGVGDWGLGFGPKPPIPNPQSPIPIFINNWKNILLLKNFLNIKLKI